ncbi:response regulator [Roseiconus nitratireducens]|uniref:Response regulator n=1 Tax=Roseiconus nitratireducens TaxID=2605748 RepID=A0A5M6D679_9BACT|nr:response regulator [Roseiconus nitratireducens]KAA5543018.1 response regulator [Roseiconus nitratireducens]
MSEGIPSIWVLEDNDEDYQILEMAFTRMDRPIRMTRFRRVRELIDQAEKLRPPTLFYCDLRLPGESGMQAISFLTANPRLQDIPKLVFSTSSNPVEIRNAYRAGANAFHVKRLSTAAMIQLHQSALKYWLDEVSIVDECKSIVSTEQSNP